MGPIQLLLRSGRPIGLSVTFFGEVGGCEAAGHVSRMGRKNVGPSPTKSTWAVLAEPPLVPLLPENYFANNKSFYFQYGGTYIVIFMNFVFFFLTK